MKRRLLTLAAVAVPLVAAGAVYAPVSASPGPATGTAAASGPVSFTCTPFQLPGPDGAAVESVTATSVPAGTFQVPGVPPLGGFPVPDVPAHCAVTVTLTHPGAGDHATVRVWLPQSGWNGRFQAVGGVAYAAGDNGAGLAAAVKQGYAAATTDAGVGGALDTGWALDSSGRINTTSLNNFASRSAHEMALVGKQVVADVYGRAASYSYWNGCSTGGRQGYMEAQKYPTDFNGVNAAAPAINWNQFEVATLWPQVVMNEEHTYPTPCEFDAFNRAALNACDTLDGVADGLVSDPGACDVDPRRLVGTTVECDGKQVTITAADAEVVRKIWDGPRDANGKRLWYGLPVGADFRYLAATTTDANGATTGAPFFVPAAWAATFVEKRPALGNADLTYAKFDEIFRKARAEYDDVIGTRDADLSAFRAAGGKLLTWHGDADQLIPTAGTVDYRERVDARMGGTRKVDDFYRVFLAPGVAHCGLGGNVDDLAALTAWVEQGKAPAVLHASLTTATGQTVVRDVCRYPMVSRYTGHGDPAAASSFRCAPASRG
ncbi:tannase/feruloyl esterase family alpha/beta hydrolase [Yinghuangia seranimata]|uniref:tannase/feruloyl esterase family alpha/beta hydrolase n=1 Tax=Yinghuangia seranimata TaxID=408067 RepID=UPI00248B24CC|nr:tannase/feruloyl esterase family alpha/beta hydrolase [Yinghuangia seranimata]MDI2124709.1 tannase/feruloyl esterase family alpha/beta hydrolase [Yinghuangia seranimata]